MAALNARVSSIEQKVAGVFESFKKEQGELGGLVAALAEQGDKHKELLELLTKAEESKADGAITGVQTRARFWGGR